MKTPPATVRRRGFTLIEVLVALVVTVSALAILSQGLLTGGRASVISQNASRAAMVAERVMTGLQTGEIVAGSGGGQTFEDEPDFSYETLFDLDPDESTLQDVTVTIRWKEREEERTFVLVRILRDRTATTTP